VELVFLSSLLELDNFKERANETEADVCLCLHHNADKGQARGWWLFYVDKKPEYEKFVKVGV
jgi:N-acetylmuramoyl-L-alanine amidase